MLHADHSGDTGTATMNWGQLTLQATSGELTVRADAASQDDLQRILDMTASRRQTFARRERLDIRCGPHPRRLALLIPY